MADSNDVNGQTGGRGTSRPAEEKTRVESLISLSLTRGLRTKTLLGLLKHLGDPEEVLSRLKHPDPTRGGGAPEGADTEDLEKALMLLERDKADVISILDKAYPPQLGNIHMPPPILYLLGDKDCLQSILVAIVGTRRATAYGRRVARWLGRELARAGIVVVSGMARGIDTEAHLGCLEAGGTTVAVLGTSVDNPYPRENRGLMKRIAKSGCVVSEFPPPTVGLPQNFPRRNRIISGLSSAIVVVEAPMKSGALITAGFALEQGKSVLAVPGEIWSRNSVGPLSLIKDGAAPVTEPQDILDVIGLFAEVGGDRREEKTVRQPDLPPIASKVLKSLERETLHVDEISTRCGLRSSEVLAELLKLEMMGFVEAMPGKFFVIGGR